MNGSTGDKLPAHSQQVPLEDQAKIPQCVQILGKIQGGVLIYVGGIAALENLRYELRAEIASFSAFGYPDKTQE